MKSEKHRKWIAQLPCLVCYNPIQTECAHVRFADPRAAKEITGMGRKPDDAWTVPLCNMHHRLQHVYGDERAFWKHCGIDPIVVASFLWQATGDHERGVQIILRAKEWNDH